MIRSLKWWCSPFFQLLAFAYAIWILEAFRGFLDSSGWEAAAFTYVGSEIILLFRPIPKWRHGRWIAAMAISMASVLLSIITLAWVLTPIPFLILIACIAEVSFLEDQHGDGVDTQM